MSDPIRKTVWEEIEWTHQLRRPDGAGWLGPTETISTIDDSAVYDASGVEVTGMLDDVAIIESTKIGFTVKGGTAPTGGASSTKYVINFKITTSLGNKFEPRLELLVTA